jgi:hypothetical protein
MPVFVFNKNDCCEKEYEYCRQGHPADHRMCDIALILSEDYNRHCRHCAAGSSACVSSNKLNQLLSFICYAEY